MINLYLVQVNMKKARKELKRRTIKKHNKDEVKVWVKAENPDMACTLAIGRICKDIVEASKMSKARSSVFMDKLKHLISVTKITPASN